NRLMGDFVGVLANSPHEMNAKARKDAGGSDLRPQPSNHDVDAHIVILLRVSRGRDSATSSLQDKRDQVAADEDDGDDFWPEEAEAVAVDINNAGEGQVNSGGVEGGADGEPDEVD